jgi:hypothetical protein
MKTYLRINREQLAKCLSEGESISNETGDKT